MQSNSYMTQRIPANWDDPELDEMSEAYISTGNLLSSYEFDMSIVHRHYGFSRRARG